MKFVRLLAALLALAATPALGQNQINLQTQVKGDLPIANGGTAATTASGARSSLGLGTLATQNAPTGSTQCVQVNSGGTVSGTGSACGSGSGSVTTTGSPASGNFAEFSGASSITNGDLSGDCTTSGTLAITCTKLNSVSPGTFYSQNYATPPAIGGTTPAAGAFTTLSASSTVSGSGFSTYLASPPAIGGTAAAAGKFTTLQSTSTTTLPITGSTQCLHVNSSGVVSGTGTDCGSGSGSGTVTSVATGLGLTGGTITTTGTIALASGSSFPGSPSTGDIFWRTDEHMQCYYDGTRWLSLALFSLPIATMDQLNPNTGSNAMRAMNPYYNDYDIYVISFKLWQYSTVSTATTYASWQLDTQTGSTVTNLGSSISGQNDTANTIVAHTTSINTVVSSSAPAIQVNITKNGVGAMSTIQTFAVTFRIVC